MVERLSRSAIGPGGGACLRYGYTPPSLRLLHARARDQRVARLARLALAAVTIVCFTVAYALHRPARGTYPPAPIGDASAPPIPLIGYAAPHAAPTSGNAPPSRFERTSGVPIGALRIGADGWRGADAASDTLPSARARAQQAAAGRVAGGAAPTPTPANLAAMQAAIQAVTANADGVYGVSVIDLTSGQELDIDADTPMDAASVNKLEILAALYHQVESGALRLDQTLTTTPDDIQDYGTGVIRYQPVGTTYTLAALAQLLIEQSDNTASYMLAQTIGLDRIDALVRSWGLRSTIVGQEISTPQDAARFMALLYQGKLANGADTRQMLDYLEHTAFNDRLPAGLPAGIVVAHKIGTQVNVENDVAIVALPGRPYVVSVFAKDVTEERAVPVEQAISRAVFQCEQATKGTA